MLAISYLEDNRMPGLSRDEGRDENFESGNERRTCPCVCARNARILRSKATNATRNLSPGSDRVDSDQLSASYKVMLPGSDKSLS